MEEDWIKIYTCSSLQEAVIVRDKLLEYGIETVEINKKDSVYISIGEIEIYCHLHKAVDALMVLDKIVP